MTQLIKTLALLCLLLADSSSAGATAKEKTENQTVPACAVSCGKPMTDSDSQDVIVVLKAITQALAERDFKTMARHLDPDCTTYDETTRRLVVGRDAIIDDVRAKVDAEQRRLKAPPIAFTIDRPYVKIAGDQAVVTFVLIKEISGTHPARYESHCSDVFVKREGEWKKLHYCGDNWKKVK